MALMGGGGEQKSEAVSLLERLATDPKGFQKDIERFEQSKKDAAAAGVEAAKARQKLADELEELNALKAHLDERTAGLAKKEDAVKSAIASYQADRAQLDKDIIANAEKTAALVARESAIQAKELATTNALDDAKKILAEANEIKARHAAKLKSLQAAISQAGST